MSAIPILAGRHIVLGVTGSIACYKAIDLASKLTQAGALVDVILTASAQQFVTPLAFQAVTGRAAYTDLWNTENTAGGGLPTHIAHIGLVERADLFLIAPCTAHHVAKLAYGLADDLISITALAARCPVLIAPAGDGSMLDHPAVVENLHTLQRRGVVVIEPEAGRHASGLTGKGRLPETPTLLGLIRAALGKQSGSLAGKRVIVTAGGTREAIDPVRYITNKSSGKQGYAVAQAAIDAGAAVTLITTPAGLAAPVAAEVIEVESAAQLLDAVLDAVSDADALIMAAAVADYRPAVVAAQKIKKKDDELRLDLTRTTDILYTVGQRKAEIGFPRVLVGFAAETQDLLENAQGKLERKNADLIVANDVSKPGAGFSGDTNIVTLLYRDGRREALDQRSKAEVAAEIIARISALLDS
jgi:phosphopantothenoylcysteine decarboxylase / phosphopantothenate---cysteine ligase